VRLLALLHHPHSLPWGDHCLRRQDHCADHSLVDVASGAYRGPVVAGRGDRRREFLTPRDVGKSYDHHPVDRGRRPRRGCSGRLDHLLSVVPLARGWRPGLFGAQPSFALLMTLLPAAGHAHGEVLSCLWYGSSFVGMTPPARLARPVVAIPLAGLVSTWLAFASGPTSQG
jgi:hypothetical protein